MNRHLTFDEKEIMLDQDATGSTQSQMHLDECRSCGKDLAQQREVHLLLRTLRVQELQNNIVELVMQRLDFKIEKRRDWLFFAAFGLLSIIMVVIIPLIYDGGQKTKSPGGGLSSYLSTGLFDLLGEIKSTIVSFTEFLSIDLLYFIPLWGLFALFLGIDKYIVPKLSRKF